MRVGIVLLINTEFLLLFPSFKLLDIPCLSSVFPVLISVFIYIYLIAQGIVESYYHHVPHDCYQKGSDRIERLGIVTAWVV